MFVYLSKKIAIPNNITVRCTSWNSEQGWIACGGDDGLLKVLKLESSATTKDKAQAPASNLSMNQTLEGHKDSVLVVTWNENYRKLTSSDSTGLIIVWMLHKGMWFEEMINNRNKSVVRDMRWTPDGQKICIAYEDGAVIVGSVDGNRLWGKELSMNLSLLEWSPDGRLILFCTPQGECHIYDQNGNSISKMQLYCMEGYHGAATIKGIDWYDGLEGYCEPNCAVLAIAMDNGRMQLMRNENDENAVLIDTGMKICCAKWNTNGSVLGVAGSQAVTSSSGDVRETCMVQFYSYDGQHLRTLRVPGTSISSLTWEGGGLRIALAVGAYVYFANVRPDYKWGYFNNTLVYAFNKPERTEACVMFWDTNSNERYAKYVKRLMSIAAAGDYCVLATRSEDDDQFILILCNAIGSPVDSKYIPIEPQYLIMTQFHVIAASADVIYVWQFRSLVSKLTSLDSTGGLRRKEGRERIFHVDELPSSQTDQNIERWRSPAGPSNEPVSAIAASDKFLMIGRVSGVVNRYSLPHLSMEGRHLLRCRPQLMALNCNSTRLSVIDINGVLSFFDLSPGGQDAAPGAMAATGEHLDFERKDVWNMLWSKDNPELFSMMEKTRMYITRGLDPEEPVQSSAYLCEFHDLEIKAVLLDEIMMQPDNPEKEFLLTYDTRSLRDARNLLGTCSLQDAYSFIDSNSHPRLWGLLAEHALEGLDFNMADKAFVRAQDYQGIQFVKHLQRLGDERKQKAEIAAFFKRFDEAEAIYQEIDRLDLAIEMRIRLGDWFKVEKLVTSGAGDDKLLETAWNKIGEYYADRHKWSKAVTYFAQAKNSEMLVEAFYVLEDFEGLEKLIHALPEGSPLLLNIADKFQSVGLCEQGVLAFTKGGDVKRAVDCCVLLNQWDQGVALAERHNFPQISGLLAKYASHLMDSDKRLEAIELYRKANHHTEAAKLLVELAEKSASQKVHPLRCKKLYVLAALEVERFRKRMLDQQEADTTATLGGGSGSGMGTNKPSTLATNAATTLAGLMTLDTASASSANNRTLDNAWHGAEGFHFWLLAHRQLYAGQFEAAMRTALHLRRYEDVLDPVDIYSFLALASFYAQFFSQCSKAFIKLESSPEVPEARREQYSDLALSIFVKNPPQDPRGLHETRGDNWKDHASGGEREEVCVASGKTIRDNNWVRCKTCKHPSMITELGSRRSCPLCHAQLPNAPPAPSMGREAVRRSAHGDLSQHETILQDQSADIDDAGSDEFPE
uniref:Wd repeat-containing protein 35 isoform x2 n=1 Tax=Tetraselmis sp. GSL018 TaxID=582737 RepID=A0A061SDB5_9CHLO|mmetsp:Transcript_29985/g.71431  ORF Transcript_29985/g.71431 Transcript_29985/m.71431 type:complete len:1242 (+) Transcript_29985:282-4007(+)|eukprot:CAMPEP_0177584862 /NCGR_PEP_ID=MMETSP0419_2-20121207/4152_1 /TAXON_ID=582737 /ORGANISM="Tetraselmis sp., Strain GSL018" /LENGTH=1241 /DNA_ID=CAMNT_0019074489 /DNA_START=204 /DNA_END=3929 /DNA_ORIENTATION=-